MTTYMYTYTTCTHTQNHTLYTQKYKRVGRYTFCLYIYYSSSEAKGNSSIEDYWYHWNALERAKKHQHLGAEVSQEADFLLDDQFVG